MILEVYETQEAAPRTSRPDLAVVIDVLRATSMMVTSLANGISCVWPVAEVEDALRLKTELGDEQVLLAGERQAVAPQGFDLGNSPLSFLSRRWQGYKLIACTSNGTRAIHLLRESERLILGSFLNAAATARCILQRVEEETATVWLVCSGTQGSFSLDDFLCAGAIADACLALEDRSWVLNDQALAALALWQVKRNALRETLVACRHGRRLADLGFQNDLAFCAQLDQYDLIAVRQFDSQGRPVIRIG